MAMAPWHLQPPGEGAKLVLICPDNTTTIEPWLSSNIEQSKLLAVRGIKGVVQLHDFFIFINS